MQIKIIILSVVCAVALANDDPTGRSCQDEKICQGLVCENNKCNCPYGKIFKSFENNKATCTDVLQSNCEGIDDCKNLEGVQCINRKCVCEAGMMPGRSPPQCLIGANYGQYCEEHSQCAVRNEQFKCIEKKCSCELDHHLNVNNNQCVKSARLMDACNDDDLKCFLEKDGRNVLYCENNVCQCTEDSKDACKGGATNVIISMATMVFFVFGVLRVW